MPKLSQRELRRRATQREAFDKWANDVAAARTKNSLLHMEWYCRNPDCSVREVTIKVKDYDSLFLPHLRERKMPCSACGQSLALHWVRTIEQHLMEQQREARIEVNVQMYERDQRSDETGGGLSGLVCASLFGDDRLPPTPDGWFGDIATAKPSRRRFVRKDEK